MLKKLKKIEAFASSFSGIFEEMVYVYTTFPTISLIMTISKDNVEVVRRCTAEPQALFDRLREVKAFYPLSAEIVDSNTLRIDGYTVACREGKSISIHCSIPSGILKYFLRESFYVN